MSGLKDQIKANLEDCELVQYGDAGSTLFGYYLKSPGTRINSVFIAFTPEGIVITGDLCPGRNGVVSTYGCGLKWFGGELSGRYLCEKFLEKKYLPDVAARRLKEGVIRFRWEYRHDDSKWSWSKQEARKHYDAVVEATRYSIADNGLLEHEFYDLYGDIFGDSPEDIGYDYDPTDAALLIAIQEKFSELYRASKFGTANVCA